MSIFIEETETKRVMFNVNLDLAQRLEQAKADSRSHGKKLDVDGCINSALEKFLKKAEKRLREINEKKGGSKKRLQCEAVEPSIVDADGPEVETEETLDENQKNEEEESS